MTDLDNLTNDYLAVKTPTAVSARVLSRFSERPSSHFRYAYIAAPIAVTFFLTWVLFTDPETTAPKTSVAGGSLSELHLPGFGSVSNLPTVTSMSRSTQLISKFNNVSITRLAQSSRSSNKEASL